MEDIDIDSLVVSESAHQDSDPDYIPRRAGKRRTTASVATKSPQKKKSRADKCNGTKKETRPNIKMNAIKSIENSKFDAAFRTLCNKSAKAKRDFSKVAAQMVSQEVKTCDIDMLKKEFNAENLDHFDWNAVLQDIESQCPLLTMIIKGTLVGPRQLDQINLHRNNTELECDDAMIPMMGNLLATIMYLRRPRTYKFVQESQSLRLWMGGCATKVIADLQRQGVCVGTKGTMSTLNRINKSQDSTLTKNDCEESLLTQSKPEKTSPEMLRIAKIMSSEKQL